MNDFDIVLKDCLEHIKNGEVKQACNYALNSGGKRVRPALLFATLSSYRSDTRKGINAAIAIEMIHTYSLIHDDLPAMDDAELRRGKPCVHKKYGEDIAILAGDTLLTEAFKYANSASDDSKINQKVVELFVEAAGGNGMVYGQELDVLNIGDKDVDLELLNTINYYKTSKLIVLPLKVAAILSGNMADLDKWEEVGTRLGLLFQIQDDLLDVTSNNDELGKDTNADENKVTYPNKMTIEECEDIINKLYDECIELLNNMMIDPEPLLSVFDAIIKREK